MAFRTSKGSGYGNSYKKGSSKGGYAKRGGGRNGGGGGRKQQQKEKHPLETSTIWLHEPNFETNMALTGFINISEEVLQVLLKNRREFFNKEYGTYQLEVAIWENDDNMSGNVRLPFDRDMDADEWREHLDELHAGIDDEPPAKSKRRAVEEEDEEEEEAYEEEEEAPKPAKSRGTGSSKKGTKGTGKTSGKASQDPVPMDSPEYDDIPF